METNVERKIKKDEVKIETFLHWNTNHWIEVFKWIAKKLSKSLPTVHILIRRNEKIWRNNFIICHTIIHSRQTTNSS